MLTLQMDAWEKPQPAGAADLGIPCPLIHRGAHCGSHSKLTKLFYRGNGRQTQKSSFKVEITACGRRAAACGRCVSPAEEQF